MPKQIYKIDQFHGGLNSNSDPRDIAENELSGARDIMVDELGKVRLMGGTAAHDAGSNTATLESGYGLHYFSHDRKGGHLATEHLDETDFATHANWDVTGKCVDSGGNLTWTYGSGALAGTAEQVHGDRVQVGIPSIEYTFTYTVTVATAPNYFTLTLDNFPASSTTLPFTAGRHKVTFTSAALAHESAFTITGTDDVGGTTTQGEFTIDNVSLYIDDETGDDYLLMADTSSSANIDIYSRATDAWGTGVIDLGSIAGMQPCFYSANGVLRVSDGDFDNANTNKWYGYIKRTHFAGLSPGGSADTYDGWYSKDQSIAAPTRGLWGGQIKGTCNGGSSDTTHIHNTTDDPFGKDTGTTLLAGTDMDTELDSGVYIAVCDDRDEARLIVSRTDEDTLVTGALGASWNGLVYRIFPPAGTGFTMNLDMNSSGGTYIGDKYQYSQTFIYDGGQESLPVIMAGDNFQNPSDNDSIEVEIFCTSPFDPRIIGGRIYQRKHPTLNTTGTGREPWSLFVDISLKDGVRENLDDSYSDWEIEEGSGGGLGTDVYMKNKDLEVLTLNGLTYESINQHSSEEVTLDARYKTAVVVNSRAYVGNVKTKSPDGEDIIMGDAMIQSPVDKYDILPPGGVMEASVRDGDEIVKLEEYADRILQFKKRKMHLINVSQEMNIIEDTYMHKGVSHPAAVCKTDFGVAWVNKLGCYLYDGKQVHNLLEKKGRQIIKESDWATFTANEPMIGYVPKKRQLIVVDDNSSTGSGDIFLYDIVTQSWVRSFGATIVSNNLTNFITDWNGDLVYAHTVGTILKWDDSSDATAGSPVFMTKDIDFGQPGQRKKVYKVYLTFRGNGTHVQAYYGVDGLDPALTFFLTNADGTTTGSGATAKCIPHSVGVNDWVKAELKPSASINNISSFRLKIGGDGSNGIASTFEINDISIIYRLKPAR